MRKLAAVLMVVGLSVLPALGLSSCGESEGKEGGTLTVSFASYPDALDPQFSYTLEGWSAMYDTYIPLLTYAHAEGEAGSEIVPGLAESLPKITDGGRTYTLKLRKGLKYSDGTPVKASDFKASVERMFELNSSGSPYYTVIVGAEGSEPPPVGTCGREIWIRTPPLLSSATSSSPSSSKSPTARPRPSTVSDDRSEDSNCSGCCNVPLRCCHANSHVSSLPTRTPSATPTRSAPPSPSMSARRRM